MPVFIRLAYQDTLTDEDAMHKQGKTYSNMGEGFHPICALAHALVLTHMCVKTRVTCRIKQEARTTKEGQKT